MTKARDEINNNLMKAKAIALRNATKNYSRDKKL